MEVDDTRDASDLSRPDWNSLEKNYELHDVGEQFIRTEVQHLGFEARAWGIDKRHEDDNLIFDDKMDLQVFGPRLADEKDELVGITEVKTKRREDWYGVINRRHLRHYLDIAHRLDVPVIIYMTLVDDGTDDDETRGEVDTDAARIVRDTFIQIQPWDEYTRVLDGEYDYYTPESAEQFLMDQIDAHPQVERTFRAPDGNQVVKLDLDTGVSWPEYGQLLVSS